MIYQKKIKKILPKKPLHVFQQFVKEKKGLKILNGGNAILYWKATFEELTEKQKEKYNKKFKDELAKYYKKMKKFKKAIFGLPKRPFNAFMLYYKDNVNEIK